MNARKEKALAALLSAATLVDAAKNAGVDPSTLYRYLHNDPEFADRYQKAQGELVENAADALKRNLLPAIETMRSIMGDAGTPPAVRIQAARGILDYSLKLTETADVLRRLEVLEEGNQ